MSTTEAVGERGLHNRSVETHRKDGKFGRFDHLYRNNDDHRKTTIILHEAGKTFISKT